MFDDVVAFYWNVFFVAGFIRRKYYGAFKKIKTNKNK